MRTLYILFLCLLSFAANAQMETDLQNQAEAYFEKFPEERVFVHIAKPEILAGDDLWFRVYQYDPKNNQPFPFSKVAYVELVNPEGEHITGARIQIDGSGGYLNIPATVNSGNYLLKVYTRWMQNFDPGSFFTTQVNVINTFKPLGLTSKPDSSRVSMAFTPESGNMIGGTRSRVGVLFLDGQGRGIQKGGSVLNRDSVVVAAFETDDFGLGVFTFDPEVGQSYRALVREDSATIREFPLPAVRPRGISFHINDYENHFVVNIEEKGTVPGKRYLAVLSRGEFRFVKSFASGESEIRINREELAEGVNQVTLFNNEGEPVAERLVFRRPVDKLNITHELEKSVYHMREKVRIDLGTYDGESQRVEADLSVSVIPRVAMAGARQMDFESYLWLGSELQTLVPGIELSKLSDEEIHRLLLVYGWRRYDWQQFSDNYTYLPELREPLISGSISGAEPTNVYFGYQDTLSNIAVATSGSDGRFHIETPNYFGNKEIILRHSGEVNRRLKIDPLFHPTHKVVPMPHFYIDSELAGFIRKQSENLQVENIFYGNKPVTRSNDESYYGQPTVSYDLEDYTRFPVMEEVMREYVYGVYVRKRQGSFKFSVLDESRNSAMDIDPMILLDGIPGFTADEIMEIDPLQIRRIEVYRSRYGTGPVMSGGIVAFYSYNSNLAGMDLSDEALKEQYQGLQPYKQFFTPDHTGSSPRLPDFRTQLFWSPQVITEDGRATLEFFTSDIPGEYLIHIQGLGSHGYAGSTTQVLEIE